MAVELPEPLQWVLLLLAGCRWPEADEDQLRDMADQCRKASETLKDATQGADAAIKRSLEGQQGSAAESLGKFWDGYTVGKGTEDDPGRLTATINALSGMGDMLEQMANSAETAKIQIVAQLGILAFELATAEAEAVVTAGASMAQVPGFIAAARAFVQKTLKTLLQDMVKMAAKQAAQMAAINLMAQGIELAEGHRKSIDWKEVGENAKGGAIGGAAGHLIGKGLGGAAGKVGLGGAANSLGGKMVIGGATGVGADAATQYITTGKVDTSSLLGSGLSGGAGVGLNHGAVKMKEHGAAPKPGDAPHIPDPVGSGQGGRQDGPPKFTKPDTSSGDAGSSYQGPSGGSGSSNSGGTTSRSDGWDASGSNSGGTKSRSDGWDTSSSNSGGTTSRSDGWDASGSNSGGTKSRSDGWDAGDSNSGGGSSRSGDSKVEGLSPFGSGRSSGGDDAPPAHSEATGGGNRTDAPAPHEQSSGGRSQDQAPPSHEQSSGGRSQDQAPAPHEQSSGGRSHEQAEAVRPAREPLAEQTPSRPVHEESQAVRPEREPLSGQEPGRPVHEQPVRSEAEGSTARPDSREGGAPVREESQAVRPTHESVSAQEPGRPVHSEAPSAPARDNSASAHESSANDGDSGSRPSGDDGASRPAGPAGPVPNLSGVLGGAANLASAASSSGHGGGSTGGTHLDGARGATLPRPDAATGPGQRMPEGLGDSTPNATTQGPVPPMAGAGFTPGPVGGGSHSGGGVRPDAPSTSAAPRPATTGGGTQQGGGSLRPGGGRGTRPDAGPVPERTHAGAPEPTDRTGTAPEREHVPAPDEQGGTAPRPENEGASPRPDESGNRPATPDVPSDPAGLGRPLPDLHVPPTTEELGRLHHDPDGLALVYPPAATPEALAQYKKDNKFNFRLTGELKTAANSLPHSDFGRHHSGTKTESGSYDVKVSPYSQSFKSHLDPLTLKATYGDAATALNDGLRQKLVDSGEGAAYLYNGNKLLTEGGKLDFRTEQNYRTQRERDNVLERLAYQDSQATWHPVDGAQVRQQLDGHNSAADGIQRLLQGNGDGQGHPGFVLGEGHSNSPSWGFLKENMAALKQAGVDTIYTESVRGDSFQRELDNYLSSDGPMSPKLKGMLESYDSNLNSPPGAGLHEMVVRAKEEGIRVQGVDGSPARKPEGVGQGPLEQRARLLNSYMHDAITSDHGRTGKYVLVTGEAHVNQHATTHGGGERIPGTAEMLGVPGVKLTTPDGTNANGSTTPDNFRLSHIPVTAPAAPQPHAAGQHPGGNPAPPHNNPAAAPGGLGPVRPDAGAPHEQPQHHQEGPALHDQQQPSHEQQPSRDQQQPHEQTPHEQQPSHERPPAEHEDGGPRYPATDGRPFDVEGGLKRPSEHDLKQLQDAVPHNADGTPQRHPDPFQGDWVKKLNGEGPWGPGRANNCADAALSVIDTYNGHPTVAAPRVEDNSVGEKGSRDRIEHALGAKFEKLGEGPAAHEKLAQTLLESGPGSSAVIITHDSEGRAHAWTAVNHDGKIAYVDGQMGRVSDKPLYQGEGGVFAVPLTPDRAPLHPAKPAGADQGNSGPKAAPHSGTGTAARPDAAPGAGGTGRPYKVDAKEVLERIGDFLPSDKRAEFDTVSKDLLDYNRADLDAKVNRVMADQYRVQKELHVEQLRKGLPEALANVDKRLADPATSAADRARLEETKAYLEEQRQRVAVYDHELARRTGGKITPELAKEREAAEKRFGPDVENRIREEKRVVADLVRQAEAKKQQAEDHYNSLSAEDRAKEGNKSKLKSSKDGFDDRIAELKRRTEWLDQDLQARKDAQQGNFPKVKESEQKAKEAAYRAAFGHSDHGVMAGEPHAEKIERSAGKDIDYKFQDTGINRNHIVADFMVHKYVAAAVFKGRALGPETHGQVSEAFGDFVQTMAPDNHRILDKYGKAAADRLGADPKAIEFLARRDLAYTKDNVDLKTVYGNKQLPDAIQKLGGVTDGPGARDAVAGLADRLSDAGLDKPVRQELQRLRAAADAMGDGAPTAAERDRFAAAANSLHQKVKQQAVEDVNLTNGITGPRQVDEAVAVLRDAAKHAQQAPPAGPAGAPRTGIKDLYPGLDGQLDGLAAKFAKEKLTTGGDAAALAEKIRNGTETQADLENLAKHLNGQREPLRQAEVDKHLGELKAEADKVTKKEPKAADQAFDKAATTAKDARADRETKHAAAEKALKDAKAARDQADLADQAVAHLDPKSQQRRDAAKNLKAAESAVTKAESGLVEAKSRLEEAKLSEELTKTASERFRELRNSGHSVQEARAITDHETVGTYYGGAHARQGAAGSHPEALFRQALTAPPAELPRLIERMANALSDSGSNLRFGDEFTNQLVQNYLDPHLIRDQDVLTAVAEGKLPKEALYSPHTLDLLRAVRGLEDKGLAPRELRDMMEPKTAADVAAKIDEPGFPTPLGNNATAEFGVDIQNPNDKVPLSSSGNQYHHVGDRPSTAVVGDDFRQGYFDPARDGRPGAEGPEITAPKPVTDADGDTVMSDGPTLGHKRGREGDSEPEPSVKRHAPGQDADGDTLMGSQPSSPSSSQPASPSSSVPTTQMADLHLFSQEPAGVLPPSHDAATPHGDQPLHERPPHERPLTEQEGGGPRHPATDGRPFDVEGGLSRPSEHEVKRLADAVPRTEDGTPQRHPDPRTGDWLAKLNGDGPGAPGRANNCVDAALAMVDTVDGRPTVAAPRHEDNGLGEEGGRDRVEQALGGRFEHLGAGAEGHAELAQTLLDGGHGSQAVITSRDSEGRTHAWHAMNHEGTIVYSDPQLGRSSDKPLYAGEGGLFALPVGPDRTPLHSAGQPSAEHPAPARPAGTDAVDRNTRTGNSIADAVALAKKADADRTAAAERERTKARQEELRRQEQARPNPSEQTTKRLEEQRKVAERQDELAGRQQELAKHQQELADRQWKLAEERLSKGDRVEPRQQQAAERQQRWEKQQERLAGQQERLTAQHERLSRHEALVEQAERLAPKKPGESPAAKSEFDVRREKLIEGQQALDKLQGALDHDQQGLDVRHEELDRLRAKLESGQYDRVRADREQKSLAAKEKELADEQQALNKARKGLDHQQKWLDKSEWFVDQHARLAEQEAAAKRDNWPADRVKALADRRKLLNEWHAEHQVLETNAEAKAAKSAKKGGSPSQHFSPPSEVNWREKKQNWLEAQKSGEKWQSAEQRAALKEQLDALNQLSGPEAKTKEQAEKLREQERLLDEQARLTEKQQLLEDRVGRQDGDPEQLAWERERLADELRLNEEARHALTVEPDPAPEPAPATVVDHGKKGRYFTTGPQELGNVSIETAFSEMANAGESMAEHVKGDKFRPGCVASALLVDGAGGNKQLIVVTASSTKKMAGDGAPEHIHPLVEFAYGAKDDREFAAVKEKLGWTNYPRGSESTRCKCAEPNLMTELLQKTDVDFKRKDLADADAVAAAMEKAKGSLGKAFVRPLETGADPKDKTKLHADYGGYKAPCGNCAPVVEYFGMKSVQFLT
ncbi:toxin glutamine deamidase domain-containing protein [Kitasatospora sp. NPDC004531]